MKITSSLIDKLLRLCSGESLPSSALCGDWVEDFLRDGVLISRSQGSRRTIFACNPKSFELSLSLVDERLGNLQRMKRLLSDDVSRSEQAVETGNSKLVSVRSCPGFPINSFEPVLCSLNGRELIVCPVEGTFMFITEWQQFSIPEDVVVVNIENMENFRLIRQQRALFSSVLPEKRLLFVSRYPQSSDLRSWLQTIPNNYVHFGDFDLAGVNIYLFEFHKYLGDRSSFLIPDDIEERLQQHGSSERYRDQYEKYKKLSSDILSLQQLINMIHKYHKCYDQEGYINK